MNFFRSTLERDKENINDYTDNIINEEVIDPFKGKSDNEIIEAIHKEFDTRVEMIKSYAEKPFESKLNDEAKKKLNKADRLESLGFHSSNSVKSAIEFVMTERLEKREIERKENLKEAVRYFSLNYPLNKFIDIKGVNDICEKYGLIYSGVSNFIGDVPDKNLEDIENFKVKKEDVAYVNGFDTIFSYETLKDECKLNYKKEERGFYGTDFRFYRTAELEIAAPKKDFNTEGMRIEGNKLVREIKDPVVLQPVMFKNVKHYLVVTAWGLEAEDTLVFNEKMN